MLCTLCGCKSKDGGDAEFPRKVFVMTYNLRYDNPGDSINSWEHRKERLANEVEFYNPDFIGIQEGLYHQVRYLADHLTGIKYIGVGRQDGDKEGEFSAIFYNASRFSLVPSTDSTLWLSPSPGKPSKGWDADLPRIVTFGKFRSVVTDKELFVFNTHFDHIGDTARIESAKLILKTIQKIAQNEPVILTGDFNSSEQKEPYKILTSSFMKDAWYASKLKPIGPEYTATGFDVCSSRAHMARIDYIFVNDYFTVDKIATISNISHGSFLSDHLPVYSELSFYQ